VNCELSEYDQALPYLSCKFIVSEGMNISNLAPELVGCLRTKLGKVADAQEPAMPMTAIASESAVPAGPTEAGATSPGEP